ncbi:MAG: ribbon-helix-helix protein, CopG family [Geodermatophilaceae bacterium]|nr:ribbon-helix-helix protein, CopG family [Geodermatophilaceae bacterium]
MALHHVAHSDLIDQCGALDAEAARTGRSISALIRDAVDAVYGTVRSSDDDLIVMSLACGAWAGGEGESEEDLATAMDGRRRLGA